MSNVRCNARTCIVYRRLSEIELSAADQQSAMQAMRDADSIADAVIWIKDRIVSLGALVLHPVFKHQAASRK